MVLQIVLNEHKCDGIVRKVGKEGGTGTAGGNHQRERCGKLKQEVTVKRWWGDEMVLNCKVKKIVLIY